MSELAGGTTVGAVTVKGWRGLRVDGREEAEDTLRDTTGRCSF